MNRPATLCSCGHLAAIPHTCASTGTRHYRPRLVKQRALLISILKGKELDGLRRYVMTEDSTNALNRISRDIRMVKRRFAEAGHDDVDVQFRITLP